MAEAPAAAAGGMGGGGIIGMAVAAAGIGISIYGGLQEAKVQQQEAQVSKEIAGYEMQINEQRRVQAGIQYQRQSVENIRMAQMAASRARAAGVAQGAQYGTGAKAGVEQAQSEQAFNQLGLYQNYQIGQNIFGLTSQIDYAKMKMADLQGSEAKWAGVAGLGSALAGGSMAIGRMSGGFGAQG
jgi:hypothetical protein